MVQKFYDDTLASKFIKQLLATENIPLCNVIKVGEIIYKNNFYIYESYIIYAVETGPFYIHSTDKLFPGDTLFPSTLLYPATGGAVAKYKIISNYSYNDEVPKLTYSYRSNMTAYDPNTHFHLGRLLRYRSIYYGIDLMPFYNCYCGQTTDDVYMSQVIKDSVTRIHIVSSSHPEFKVYCIPIKFNKEYTLAIDCGVELCVGFRLFNSDYGLVYDKAQNSLSDYLIPQNFVQYTSSFNKPFKVCCNLEKVDAVTTKEELFKFENDLQMLVQVPSSNKSSIVVLEGDYTNRFNTTHNLLDNTLIKSLKNKEHLDDFSIQFNLMVAENRISYDKRPSLLTFNTKQNYAFSYRLVEHLLLSSVNNTEQLSGNIARLQKLLQKEDPIYDYRTSAEKLPEGVWSSRMDAALRRQMANMSLKRYIVDLNTEFNSDVERYYQDTRGVNLDQ